MEKVLKRKVEKSNQMADMALDDLEQCLSRGVVAVVEHPSGSWLWKFPASLKLLDLKGVYRTLLFQQD